MVKIGNLRLFERFKGFVDKYATSQKTRTHLYELIWNRRCDYYDRLALEHGLAKSQCMTIAGQCTANGVFLKPYEREGEAYPRSQEAVRKLEEFNRTLHLRSLIHKTAYHMALRGSFFWEKTWTPTFNLRAIPQQKYIEPAEVDAVDGVTKWRQVMPNGRKVEWNSNELVHFAWNVTDESWPYGTSLLSGLGTEFDTLAQLETDIQAYTHKTASPKEVISLNDKDYRGNDDDVTAVRSQFRNWEPGEQIVTNYPVQYTAGGVGDRKFESLDSVLAFLKEQLVDGTMVPPISKQYNATEASAKEMMPFFHANIIEPIQEIITEKLTTDVYEPYLMDLGYSVKLCPEILWEPPDANRDENAAYYTSLVQAQIMPPSFAAEALGFGEEYALWRKEEDQRENERMQAAKLNPQQEGKRYEVTEFGGRS